MYCTYWMDTRKEEREDELGGEEESEREGERPKADKVAAAHIM